MRIQLFYILLSIWTCLTITKIPETRLKQVSLKFKEQGGLVLRPEHDRFLDFTTPWNQKCKKRPYLVFVPTTYLLAQEAFILVKQAGVQFSIMSGGHDYECSSTTDSVLINLMLLKRISVDLEKEVAILQAGVRWGEVYDVLDEKGYDIPGGQCPAVGVAGYTLGTGFNWLLSRYYGSAAQNTESVVAVLANGQLVQINWDNEYKDLMWGLMGGGGGQFAMVLEFTIKIFKQPQGGYSTYNLYYTFTDDKSIKQSDTAVYPLSAISEIFIAWTEVMAAQKEDTTVGGNNLVLSHDILNLTPRTFKLYLSGFCRGEFCDWKTRYSKILSRYPASINLLGERSTFKGFGIIKEVLPLIIGYPLERFYLNELSALTYAFTPQMVDSILHFMIPEEGDTIATQNYYAFETTYFSGSVKNKEKTSFAFPDIEWKSNFFIMWDESDSYDQIRDSARAFNRMMEQAAGSHYAGNYFNYIDTSVEEWQQKYFGRNYQKLQKLKTKYDREGIFKREYGRIEPYQGVEMEQDL